MMEKIAGWKTVFIGFTPFIIAVLNFFGIVDIGPSNVEAWFDGVAAALLGLSAAYGTIVMVARRGWAFWSSAKVAKEPASV